MATATNILTKLCNRPNILTRDLLPVCAIYSMEFGEYPSDKHGNLCLSLTVTSTIDPVRSLRTDSDFAKEYIEDAKEDMCVMMINTLLLISSCGWDAYMKMSETISKKID